MEARELILKLELLKFKVEQGMKIHTNEIDDLVNYVEYYFV